MAGYRGALGIKEIIAFGLLFGLVTGCTSNRGEYVGDWIGKKGLEYDTPDPTISGTLDRVRLEIKSNDDFMLIDGGVPMQGKVRWGGDGGTLDVKEVLGRKANIEVMPTVAKKEKQILLELEGRDIMLDRVK